MINLNFIKLLMSLLFIQFIVSILFLFTGTQLLVNSAISISNKLNINRLIIGLTIVSLATSLPELFVTLQASLKGYYDFAIGNIIGSNISNISFVLGTIAIISPIIFSKKEMTLNYLPLLFISVLFVMILISFGLLNIIYGCVSIILLIGFNIFILLKGEDLIITEEFDDTEQFYFFGKQFIINKIFTLIVLLLIGTLILWLGSELLIKSSKDIATIFGISDRVISITLVALGTSLPELFASVYAASKSETKLAIGNLLGSNIFNILAVLGITSIVRDIYIGSNLYPDAIIMLLITLFLVPVFYFRKIIKTSTKTGPSNLLIYKSEGFLLLFIYIIYIVFTLG